jgi:hypothetical protein
MIVLNLGLNWQSDLILGWIKAEIKLGLKKLKKIKNMGDPVKNLS